MIKIKHNVLILKTRIKRRCAQHSRRLIWCSATLSTAASLVLLCTPPPAPSPLPSPLRHLPLGYWAHINEHKHDWQGCVEPPRADQVLYVTTFWQRLAPLSYERKDENNSKSAGNLSDPSEILAFSAHWDDRAPAPCVRVVIYSEKPIPQLYCHFWFFNRSFSALASAVEVKGAKGGARVLKCDLKTDLVPAAVSLSRQPCEKLHTLLKVQGAPEHLPVQSWWKKGNPVQSQGEGLGEGVGVCAVWSNEEKARRGREGAKLHHWLQRLNDLKVSAVYLYVGQAPPDVLAVAETWSSSILHILPYYAPIQPAKKTSAAIPEYWAGGSLLEQGWSDPAYAVPLTDCLLRAGGVHRWVMQLDYRHYVVVMEADAWSTLLSSYAGVHLPRYWSPRWLQPKQLSGNKSPMETHTHRAPELLAEDGGTSLLRTAETIAGAGFKHAICVAPCSGPHQGPPIMARNWPSPQPRASRTERPLFCDLPCQMLRMPSDKLRLHLFSDRCGPYSRSYCRQLSTSAVYDVPTGGS